MVELLDGWGLGGWMGLLFNGWMVGLFGFAFFMAIILYSGKWFVPLRKISYEKDCTF